MPAATAQSRSVGLVRDALHFPCRCWLRPAPKGQALPRHSWLQAPPSVSGQRRPGLIGDGPEDVRGLLDATATAAAPGEDRER